MKSIQPDNIAW